MRKIVSIFVLCVFLLTAFATIPNTKAWPEVTEPQAVMSDYFIDEIFQFENMSIRGYVVGWNQTTKNVYWAKYEPGPAWRQLCIWYASNRTTKDLYRFPGGEDIVTLVVAQDGSLLVSVKTNKIYRSTDGGQTFSVVLTMASGTWSFRMATRGPYVYAIEYGISTVSNNQSLWLSVDNGKPGTWSIAARTLNKTIDKAHWHLVYVDPYTNYVWAVNGDDSDGCFLSTDGIHFQRFGPAHQCPDAAANQYNVFFASDPGDRILFYNKTTDEWGLLGVGYGPRNLAGSMYELKMGYDGVLYARTVMEYPGKLAYLFMSPDGHTLVPIRNQSGAVDWDMRLKGPIDGYFWFGDSSQAGYIYRFRDISMNEARALAKAPKPKPASSTIVYEHPSRAFNGEDTVVSFTTEHITDATLKITGVSVENLMTNGGCEVVDHFWHTSDETGWRQANASESEKWNLCASFDTSRAHSGVRSVHIQGFNNTNYHGMIRLTKKLWPATLPSGTTVTFSIWYQISNTDPDKNRQSGTIGVTGILVYTDFSSATASVVGGPGHNSIAQFGNMTSTQWTRAWGSVTATKAVSYLIVSIEVYGFANLWVDDIQAQVGPYLTPYVPDGAVYNTTNPRLTINGVTYSYNGNLSAGQNVSFPIGDLCGIYRVQASCGGSKVFNWSITGTHVSLVDKAFVTYNTGMSALKTYTGHRITIFGGKEEIINASSFSGHSSQPILLMVKPTTTVQISVKEAKLSGPTVLAWNTTGTSTVVYSIVGLSPLTGYKVYRNGMEIYAVSAGFSLFQFTVTGNSEYEVRVWNEFSEHHLPVADFTYSVHGNTVTFTDASKSDAGIKTWFWNFGDGYTSTEQNPTHEYAKPGKYNVELIVQDMYGNLDSTSKTIVIGGHGASSIVMLLVMVAFAMIIIGLIATIRNPTVAIVMFIVLVFIMYYVVRNL